ncbi:MULTISPECIES: hypothetical protein [Curtobacterium]|uniref:Uncharacterized protein n=1 Tax=Curtobacterium flaccumfaciens pv. flaccumfaciens TaxID=138532 RepID=A0A9Q2W416_9MICO|nr:MULTISPECIES: hypothetical protein [Curtobacterium]MBT1541543.1 hypothetical protein [Curtobacterium flaccumfaciens pv. flaccumfaciens]MCU0152274.1 hypothetical protein [Curtobacterium flaccumfaciens pv. poinsettiae]UXZ57993.1 hypothetical protein MXD64_01025 [Curtobacterium sp. Arg-1]
MDLDVGDGHRRIQVVEQIGQVLGFAVQGDHVRGLSDRTLPGREPREMLPKACDEGIVLFDRRCVLFRCEQHQRCEGLRDADAVPHGQGTGRHCGSEDAEALTGVRGELDLDVRGSGPLAEVTLETEAVGQESGTDVALAPQAVGRHRNAEADAVSVTRFMERRSSLREQRSDGSARGRELVGAPERGSAAEPREEADEPRWRRRERDRSNRVGT